MNELEEYRKLLDEYVIQKFEKIISGLKKVESELKKVESNIEKNPVGFEEDPIFLLSVYEYQKYTAAIPQINHWWWLRSPGECSLDVAGVDYNSSIFYDGFHNNSKYGAVRPAFKYEGYSDKTFHYHSKFCFNGVTWIVIDPIKKIAIAEMPIDFRKFDDTSNDYKKSTIRKYLSWWFEEHHIQGA